VSDFGLPGIIPRSGCNTALQIKAAAFRFLFALKSATLFE
jgi:hypothetical protein